MIPLLMTASVSTRGMKGACFSDEEREKMYIEALRFYIDSFSATGCKQQIVFAENSGWDLNLIRQKLSEFDLSQIEFISVSPRLFNISRGKGYNELLLITNAIIQSKYINNIGAFMKVTGRYPILNISNLLSQASIAINKESFELYCDIKDHKIYDWLGLGWNGHSFDCRIFATTTSFFLSNIAPLYKECDDYAPEGGKLMEDVLFKFVKNSTGKYSLRFKREPKFGGVEGSDSSSFAFSKNQNSLKSRLKIFLGNCIRIFLPQLKF